jgi:hypothetical protein
MLACNQSDALTSRVLHPFHRDEAITIKKAAGIADKSEGTVRNWCNEHEIGRRIAGGTWSVSRVALAMLLDGANGALGMYLRGERQHESVATYYRTLGLGHLLSRPEFQDAGSNCG